MHGEWIEGTVSIFQAVPCSLNDNVNDNVNDANDVMSRWQRRGERPESVHDIIHASQMIRDWLDVRSSDDESDFDDTGEDGNEQSYRPRL